MGVKVVVKFFKGSSNEEADIERKDVDLKLSIHPDQETSASDFQKSYFQDELDNLPKIKEGDINISTTYVYDLEDKLEIGVYFRNGLSKAVNMDKVQLLLINSKNELVCSDIFNLREMGDVPAHSARPWKVYFDKANIDMEKSKHTPLVVQFNTNIRTISAPNLKLDVLQLNIMDDEQDMYRQKFQRYVDTLPALEEGQFSINTYSIVKPSEVGYIVTLVMRNSSVKQINIEKFPIILKDNEGNILKKEIINNNLIINPISANVYSYFILFDDEQQIPDSKDIKVYFNAQR